MKQLIIVGARGFGRELFSASQECIGYGVEFVVKGFLDSKLDALNGFEGYPPILGSPDNYEIKPDDVFITALGDPQWRRHYVDLMESKGARFLSLIHRSAAIGKNVKIGEGVYIARNAMFSVDIHVGNHVCVFNDAIVGHDAWIGNFSHLSAQTFMGGGSRMEDGAVLHPGARVAPHKRVGENAVVGIGSVVVSNVKDNTVVFGMPAQEFM